MHLIHIWPYLDEQKNVLGLVKRFETENEKGELQKILVPYFKREDGEWKKGGAAKPRPLYNLPGIFRCSSLVVTEGEKCASALMQLGFPVTTSCGGAHGVKEADWSACREARKIYLLPDNDEPGETYIASVAECLKRINSSVELFVLRLPGLDVGGDVVDWIQQRVPTWNGYAAIPEMDRAALLASLKKLFVDSPAYVPPEKQTAAPAAETKKKPAVGDNHVDNVRQALSISAVLQRYGKEWQGENRSNGCTRICSPFASDSNPSFDYNEQEKWFNCFSSGKKGDAFALIAELEGCSTKGDDWRRVIEVAESITGIARPKQEKKSNVTSLQTRLPVNLDAIAQELLSIPNENVPAEDAFVACQNVLRMMAASDGQRDEFLFDQIRSHFQIKASLLQPFRKAVRMQREELKKTGRIEKKSREPKGNDDTVDAPRELYLELFPRFLGEIRRDIFSGDCLCWDQHENSYVPVLNQMKLLKSRFLEYGEKNNVRFFMSAVDYHFEEYAAALQPRLVLDIPEWDGKDYIKMLCDRVKLKPIALAGHIDIDNSVLEQFMKDWHAKMWLKLWNPQVQNRIIVLRGDQGIGKDFWQAEQLGALGQFLVPMTVEDSNKDTRAQLHQGLAITISEFDRTMKQHTSTIKDLLTASTTMIRLPYDARAKFRSVRCSFMASCNVDEILRDHTGNRRYIIFHLLDINRSQRFTHAQRLQVLAQGQHLARLGYQASEPAEAAMKAYVAGETPQAPAALLLEEWDDMAHQHYLTKLTPEQRQACERAARHCKEDGAVGFMPNRFVAEDRLFEKLSRKFGWNERYAVTILSKTNRRGRLRFKNGITSSIERGFFWMHPDASIDVTDDTPEIESVTANGASDECDFL